MNKLFVFIVLIFFLLGRLSGVLAQQTDTARQNIPKPIFENGEAQVVPEFASEEDWIKEELWVETSFDSDDDGKLDRMHVFVTRPKQTSTGNLKLPVIYTSSPYFGLKVSSLLRQSIRPLSKNIFWNVKHEIGEIPKSRKHPRLNTRDKRPLFSSFIDNRWVPRGYVVVYSSSPGTGLSDGAITVGGENESLAPKAVIDWLCGRASGYRTRDGIEEVYADWSSGKVGMTGTSYDGTICLAAATTGVKGLEAIIPIAPISSYYRYYRSNGLVRSPEGYLGEDMDVLYDFINTGDKSKRLRNNTLVRDCVLVVNQDRITGDYNDFWKSRDYLNQIENMRAAMIMAHGLNDWNVMPEQSYRFFIAAREKGLPTQLYYHEYGHGGNPPFQMMNRWFTRYLHGIENDVENDPQVWIEREDDSSPKPLSSFPDSNASNVILYLDSGHNRTGHLCLNKTDTLNSATFVDDHSINFSKLHEPKFADHRLLFVTPFLTSDLRLSGLTNVSIKIACNKSAANLSVYLITLPWEESKYLSSHHNIITRGWADPQNAQSINRSNPLIPGEYVQLSFDLMPDDQIISKGNRIGLMIFSSDQEFTLCPKPGTELTVDLNSTYISLPIVGGILEYEKSLKNE